MIVGEEGEATWAAILTLTTYIASTYTAISISQIVYDYMGMKVEIRVEIFQTTNK